jgi:hypothetical protein
MIAGDLRAQPKSANAAERSYSVRVALTAHQPQKIEGRN